MDILNVLITVLAIAAYFWLSSRKKTKEEPVSPSYEKAEEEVYNDYQPDFMSEINNYDEKGSFYSKKEDYFTFREKNAKELSRSSKDSFRKIEEAQNIENEEENEDFLSIDAEEMRKAVLYSEILKRPYY